jgi:peptide/nickel transport system substrate-binding protein
MIKVLSRAAVYLLFSSPVLTVSGCEKDRPAGADGPVLVVGLEGNPTALDPRVAQDAYSTRIFPLVFEGLVILDKNSDPIPRLAQSWEQPEPLTFQFRIRRGHRTPDGREITSRDVVYTFESLNDPAFRSPRRILLENIEEIRAVDDYTVIFRLKEPYAPFLTDMALGIVPRSARDLGPEEFRKKPYGSGPYQVESFEPGGQVDLCVNPEYNGPKPGIERIVFRVLPDDVTRVFALERGEVHLLQNSAPPDDIPMLEKNPRLRIVQRPGTSYSYIGFNLEDPVLSDLRVRRAVAHAIDREKIAGSLLRGTVTLATGLLPPSHWAYNPEVTVYDYDPALAASLLDQAGYPDPDGDGPLTRFKLVYKTSQNKTRRWVAEAVADQLSKVGVGVEVRSHEWGTFFADVRAGKFQIYSLSWVGAAEPDIYYWALHSQSMPPAGANRNRYSNPEFDRLAERGRRAADREERKMIYSRIQEIAAHDLPYVSLWYTNNVAAMDKRLHGFEFFPGGDYRSLARAGWYND